MRKVFKIRANISKRSKNIIFIVFFVALLALWVVISGAGLIDEKFLPTPWAVINDIIESTKDGTLISDVKISIYRVLTGFSIAVLVGVPLGIMCGCFTWFQSCITPLCGFIRYMPVQSFVPIIVLYTGIGETSKITVVFIGTLFQLILMIADDVSSVPNDLINSGYTLGNGYLRTIYRVIIPYIFPKMMRSLRMIVGWAWGFLICAELVASNSGLGYRILSSQRFFKTETIFGSIFIIGLLGLITDLLFAFLIKVLFPWEEEEDA